MWKPYRSAAVPNWAVFPCSQYFHSRGRGICFFVSSYLVYAHGWFQLQVVFEVADTTKREFSEESFDVIYSRDTILHIKDKKSLFANFFVSDYRFICLTGFDLWKNELQTFDNDRVFNLTASRWRCVSWAPPDICSGLDKTSVWFCMEFESQKLGEIDKKWTMVHGLLA